MRNSIHLLLVGALVSLGASAFAGAPDNFHEVRPDSRCLPGQGAPPRQAGTIFRGARPGEEGLLYLRSIGVMTLVNLEGEGAIADEQDELARLGLAIVLAEHGHPMSGGFGVNELPDGSYDHESIIAAVAELRRAKNFPLFVHCHYGDDRTGMVVALHRVYNECWPADEAEAEWRGIAGAWHSLWNQPKFDYFETVTRDPALDRLYKDHLGKP
jgi:hypothetical protein